MLAQCEPLNKLSSSLLTAMLGEEPGEEMAPMLEELGQSALRELCNRIGASLSVGLPPAESYDITFPIFFFGRQVNIQWDYSLRVIQQVRVNDEFTMFFMVGLSDPEARKSTAQDRIRSLEELRASILRKGA